MSTCTATKKDGSPCTLPSSGPDGLCWVHSPTNAAARRRGQSRGGRGAGSAETRAVKKLMDDLTDKTLSAALEPSVVHAVVALQNIKLRAIEQERKVKETEHLEARIQALEDLQDAKSKGARRWR